MSPSQPCPAPLRLVQMSREAATLFKHAESEFRGDLDEQQAWQRLQTRLSDSRMGMRPSSHRRTWFFVGLAGCLVLGWAGVRSLPRLAKGPPVAAPLASASDASSTIRLAPGKSLLPRGIEVELQPNAESTYRSQGHEESVEVRRGRAEIKLTRITGRVLVVKAGAYQFRIREGRLVVAADDQRVTLGVYQGTVDFRDAANVLRTVTEGEEWSNSWELVDPHTFMLNRISTPEIPSAASSSTAEAMPSADAAQKAPAHAAPTNPYELETCRELLRSGLTQKSEQCYLAVATDTSFAAEMALMELARLRRDARSDLTGSLATLDQYEARFPSGTLAAEVRMARIELLARLGRIDEALSHSRQLLATAQGRARAVELHLLRGNLLRDKKLDCSSAQAEYRSIASDPGPRGAEAQWALAECLERLGRKQEALLSYRSYLERPNPRHAERARQRVRALSPAP